MSPDIVVANHDTSLGNINLESTWLESIYLERIYEHNVVSHHSISYFDYCWIEWLCNISVFKATDSNY